MWKNYYEDNLLDWIEIRDESKNLPIEEALHLVNDYWQQVPTIPHYLHLDDYKTWPSPWELLADNNFCEVAKAAGIVYTIILVERSDIISMSLLQDDNYTYVQVITKDMKYLLNNQPICITADLGDVSILHELDCKYFTNKLI